MIRSTPASHVVAAAFALLVPAALAAQTSHPEGRTGQLRGQVYDSTRSEPLEDARVVLWNTSLDAVTDEEGRFAIEDVPAGDYSVVFFHERLGHLGVSSGMRRVAVRADETSSMELGTPSMVTIHSTHCAAERAATAKSGGTATGRVRDGNSGVALPRARVTLTWRGEDSGELREATATADEEGWYRVCDVPKGRVVGARARFLDRSGVHQEFSLAPDSAAARVDFFLDQLQPSDVTGTVRDVGTSEPVSDAEVTLLGTQYRGITDEDGSFRFESVPPGTYSVEVSHLAYGSRTDTVQVGTGLDVQMAVKVSMEPVELDPITVTADARDLEEALEMGGHVISREEIDAVRHRSRDVGDLLRSQNIRGFIVRRQGNDICAGFMPGQNRIMKSNCQSAAVYIDGVRQSLPRVAMDLQANVVERIILYRPIEAGTIDGLAGSAGVIKIITRSADIPR